MNRTVAVDFLKSSVYCSVLRTTLKLQRITLMPTVLGTKINKLRKEKKLTLEQLADLTGSVKSYIWELENKAPPRPSADKLSKIADKLGVTLDYLLDEGETIQKEDAIDAKFYRKYQKMDSSTKDKIRQMVELWDDDD